MGRHGKHWRKKSDYIWQDATRSKKTCRNPTMRILTCHEETWRELERLLTRRDAGRLGETPQDSTVNELTRTEQIQQRYGRPGKSSQAFTRLGRDGLTWTRKEFGRRGKAIEDFPGIGETWEDFPRCRAALTSHFATIYRLSIPTPGTGIWNDTINLAESND